MILTKTDVSKKSIFQPGGKMRFKYFTFSILKPVGLVTNFLNW